MKGPTTLSQTNFSTDALLRVNEGKLELRSLNYTNFEFPSLLEEVRTFLRLSMSLTTFSESLGYLSHITTT